jgi:uncharacterized membrane-anchored protein
VDAVTGRVLENAKDRRERTCRKNGVPAVRLSKVPEVTLAFWVIKIVATTLGETGGDAVSMTMEGYAVSSVFFIGIFVVVPARSSRSRSRTHRFKGFSP